MKVVDLINIPLKGTVICGESDWNDNVFHEIGDIISSNKPFTTNVSWEVIAVEKFLQGCFGVPAKRFHSLILKPKSDVILPKIGDVLIKTMKSRTSKTKSKEK